MQNQPVQKPATHPHPILHVRACVTHALTELAKGRPLAVDPVAVERASLSPKKRRGLRGKLHALAQSSVVRADSGAVVRRFA